MTLSLKGSVRVGSEKVGKRGLAFQARGTVVRKCSCA